MKKNGLKHRPLTFTQGRTFRESTPKTARTSAAGSFISWVFVLLFGAWMFILGVMVGRQTVPADVETVSVQAELAALSEKQTLKDKAALAREEEAVLLRETDLEFYDALKRGGDSTQAVSTAPDAPSENAADSKKPAAVKRPSETPVAPESILFSRPAATAPVAGDGAYAIQVASFILPEDADRLVARLKEKGYPHARRADENVSGHGIRYRVNVGVFNSRDAADALLQRLRTQENYADAYVRRR